MKKQRLVITKNNNAILGAPVFVAPGTYTPQALVGEINRQLAEMGTAVRYSWDGSTFTRHYCIESNMLKENHQHVWIVSEVTFRTTEPQPDPSDISRIELFCKRCYKRQTYYQLTDEARKTLLQFFLMDTAFLDGYLRQITAKL